MKIKYQFVNETVEIEVDEKWSAVIAELDRLEYNNNHTETRRHCSLDSIDLETGLGTDNDPFIELLGKTEFKAVYDCLAQLTERQQYLLTAVYMDGRSQADIAREQGCSRAAITRAINRAKAVFIKIYEETVNK